MIATYAVIALALATPIALAIVFGPVWLLLYLIPLFALAITR